MLTLDPITRPNGKTYQPRKIRALYAEGDFDSTVYVLGTHDQDAALPLAIAEVQYRVGGEMTTDTDHAYAGWFRETMRDGERWIVHDDVRGAAGVAFDCWGQ